MREQEKIDAMLAAVFTPAALDVMLEHLGDMEQSCMGILLFNVPTLRDVVRLLNQLVNPDDYPAPGAEYVRAQRLDNTIVEYLKYANVRPSRR